MKGVKTLSHTVECIGLLIRSTKVNYTWKFLLDSTEITVVLLVSKLTSKVVILLNGMIKFQGKKTGKYFTYEFDIDEFHLAIVENEASYDLFINDLSFLVMHNRHASTLLLDSASNSFIIQAKKAEVREVPVQEMAEWEKAAKSYRLIFRDLGQAVREKVPIKPNSLLRLDNQFLSQNKKNYLTPNYFLASFAQTTPSSHTSENPYSRDRSVKQRRSSYLMNFFLAYIM